MRIVHLKGLIMQAIQNPGVVLQRFQSFVELTDDRWHGAVRTAPSGSADSLVISWEKPITLRGARGTRVVATAGSIWMTQTGRAEDHVLEVGNSVLVTEDEVVITAFGTGRVLLIPAVGAAAHRAQPKGIRQLEALYLRWMHRLASGGRYGARSATQ